jgi:hypothetical protein
LRRAVRILESIESRRVRSIVSNSAQSACDPGAGVSCQQTVHERDEESIYLQTDFVVSGSIHGISLGCSEKLRDS